MKIDDPFQPTLTDRYIWAAIKQIPKARRRAAAKDIETAVEARKADLVTEGISEEEAEYQALKDLGEPHLWARGYQEYPLQIIGPNYYLEWRKSIFVILGTVVPGLAAASVLVNYFSGFTVFENVIGTLMLAATASVHVLFWVTVICHFVERSGRRFTRKWEPNNLPESPSDALPRMYDIIIAAAIFFLMCFLAIWQQIRSPLNIDGEVIPIVNPEMWHFWLPVIFVWLFLNVVYVIWMYRHGRWTFRGAFINSAFSLLLAVPLIWLIVSGRFFNPVFFRHLGVEQLFSGGGIIAFIIALVVAAIFVWDIADNFIRADKRRLARMGRYSTIDVTI